jgi:hypothetical protein
MIFGIFLTGQVPISRVLLHRETFKSIKNKEIVKWHHDCRRKSASDVPAAGKIPASPMKRRHPARATANVAALKRE